MHVVVYKKVNYKSRIGEMILKIRQANNDIEKIEDVYRNYGMGDRNGNVVNMEYSFLELEEGSYQTNKGIPYTKNFPSQIFKEKEITEFMLVVISPEKLFSNKKQKTLVRGSKLYERIEAFKNDLLKVGIEEEDMEFLKQMKEEKDIFSQINYETMIKPEDIVMIDFSDVEDYQRKVVKKQQEIQKKYQTYPKHWIKQ